MRWLASLRIWLPEEEEEKETYGRTKWLRHFSIRQAASCAGRGGKLTPIDSNARIQTSS